jgi:hypothetical protein
METNTTKPGTLGEVLNNAGIPVEGDPTPQNRPKARIILNGERIERSRKTDYLRMLNEIVSSAQTLKDFISEIDNEVFRGVYREREGSHPITMDTELKHRLRAVIQDLDQTSALFSLESMDYQTS